MRIDRKKALTLFALTLLITSLLLANMNVGTGQDPELIYLHGPSLTPTHMHSTEPLVPIHMNSNMTLTPVHMHYIGDPLIDPIYEPICTPWHELYPEFCEKWHLTSWIDYNGDGILSPNDQIDMTDVNGIVTWYHVDRITWTMLLSNPDFPEGIIYVEYKGSFEPGKDPIEYPICTYWHEVYPNYCNVYHIVDATGPLEWCTYILLEQYIDGMPTEIYSEWHVEEVVTDLILREKIMDPRCTWWHEIYPNYCKWSHLTSWEDTGEPFGQLSPSDQIDMDSDAWYWDTFWSMGDVNRDGYINETDAELIGAHFCTGDPQYDINKDGHVDLTDATICANNIGKDIWTTFPDLGKKEWYHVDRVTITLNVTLETEPSEWMKIELKTYYFEEMYNALKHPVDTLWHEVYPDYSNVYALTWWDWWKDDNCNGVLDVCDYIWLYNVENGIEDRYHVEDICYDIILNKKIMDPICTWWYELEGWPYGEELPFKLHHLTSWEEDLEDPYPGRLSPHDQIDMYNETSGETKWYHVDRVTLTLNVSIIAEPGFYYLFEYKGPFENIYQVKIDPYDSLWHLVWPDYEYNPEGYPITTWEDNCNGVLDRCDNITLGGVLCHVEDLAIDLILNEKIMDPVSTRWHELYPEFCNWYHIIDWEDNGDGRISPCDMVNLDPIGWWHVKYVTVTINITDPLYPGDWILLEYYYEGPVETMYWVKTHPIGSWWYEPGWFEPVHQIEDWMDNCNGVLDYCDYVMFYGDWYHVAEVSIDIIVEPPPIHDVGVDRVQSLLPWVYQGQIDPIDVTVTNYGDFVETVTVNAFYDGNPAAAPQIILNMNPGDTQILRFDWDTTGVPPGWYTVSATATIAVDDVPGNNHLVGNDQEVKALPPPPEDLEFYPPMVVDLEFPYDTQWHELHPSKTNYYHLTDWLPGTVLGPEDWVMMDAVLWFLVDDLTIDIEVRDMQSGILYWLDYECGYWTFNPKDPVCTKWNEIKNSETHMPPEWPRCWHLTEWDDDNGDGILSYCDYIWMTPNDPFPGTPHWFHVEFVTVTLKLTDEGNQQHYLEFMGPLEEFEAIDGIHFPWGTDWLEIWPEQGRPWILTDWADQPYLAPSDQIVLTLKDPRTHIPIPGIEAEYHVDKVTVAMNLTDTQEETHIVKFEGSLVQFKYHYWTYDPPYSYGPFGTQWHEVNPTYCRQWYIVDWSSQDMVLGYCDLIWMVDKKTGEVEEFHVESLSTDIYVTPLAVHDVAVTNVTSAKTVICQGYCGNITATVENQGDFTETFNVTAYANTTAIGTKQVTLASGDSEDVPFRWNTTGFSKGNYTISAVADTVPGETETGDNTYVDDWIIVSMIGDITGGTLDPMEFVPDGKVDMKDIATIARFFGQNVPPAPPNCDITGPTTGVPDGKIDMRDIATAARHFGEKDP